MKGRNISPVLTIAARAGGTRDLLDGFALSCHWLTMLSLIKSSISIA